MGLDGSLRNRFQQSAAVWLCAAMVGVPAGAGPARGSAEEEASAWVSRQLATLSLERKLGQMIVPPIRGEYRAADDPEYQSWLRLVREDGVGGLVVYGGSPAETALLLNRLQGEAELPLLVAADFESGPGQQLSGASEFPANMALGAIGSEELAYRVGAVGAREGRAVGIHVTYSPVVDVQTLPSNPAAGVRSFSRDLDLLGRLSAAYIRGYQENGMLATAKHYPGRGDVELIPGSQFTINPKPEEQVVGEDFAAFRSAIGADVAYIMSEHIAVPAVTGGSELPASVEEKLARYWLRERLGFRGILTSDDLWYDKVTDRFGAERVGVLVVRAGHDALLKPKDPRATIEALAAAVRAGEIPEAQIDASVEKILYAKARLGLHRERLVDPAAIPGQVATAEHRALVTELADRSLTLVRDDGFFPTSPERVGRVAHVLLHRRVRDAAPAAVAAKLAAAFPVVASTVIGPDTDDALRARALASAREADTVVVSLFSQRRVYVDNGALPEADLRLIGELAGIRPQATVVMSYGNPYLAPGASKATAFATGYGEGGFYGNQLVYADSFVKLMKGELVPQGRLPVTVSPDLPIGTGETPSTP